MASCSYCKDGRKEPLKSCACKKVSYCSKECQAKDWKVHKPSCPPYIIKESPGKGRGLFATRKIKEGQVILEEYPLLTISDGVSTTEFQDKYYPNIDEETKAKILQMYDPAENFKKLDTETVKKLVSTDPLMMWLYEAKTDEVSKILRIFNGNSMLICGEPDLYSNTSELGLYHNIFRINHSCVPNATICWVMGDFQRKQVRALMTIEKGEEILISYRDNEKFRSRQLRRQELLETEAFLCECSECTLEGEDLVENERMRAEVMETEVEMGQLARSRGSEPISRSGLKKVMKLTQRKVKLIQKLNLRAEFVATMVIFYRFALVARRMDITSENDPDVYKQEALKYAKLFGDNYIHLYNKQTFGLGQ